MSCICDIKYVCNILMYDMSEWKSYIFIAFENPYHIDKSVEYVIQKVTMEKQYQVAALEAQCKNSSHVMKLWNCNMDYLKVIAIFENQVNSQHCMVE